MKKNVDNIYVMHIAWCVYSGLLKDSLSLIIRNGLPVFYAFLHLFFLLFLFRCLHLDCFNDGFGYNVFCSILQREAFQRLWCTDSTPCWQTRNWQSFSSYQSSLLSIANLGLQTLAQNEILPFPQRKPAWSTLCSFLPELLRDGKRWFLFCTMRQEDTPQVLLDICRY